MQHENLQGKSLSNGEEGKEGERITHHSNNEILSVAQLFASQLPPDTIVNSSLTAAYATISLSQLHIEHPTGGLCVYICLQCDFPLCRPKSVSGES